MVDATTIRSATPGRPSSCVGPPDRPGTALGPRRVVATELECSICTPDWKPVQSHVQYSSLTDTLALEASSPKYDQALLGIGIPIESSNPEYGPGQLEINFASADPMTTADNTVLFKSIVKEIATQTACEQRSCPSRTRASQARACTFTRACRETASTSSEVATDTTQRCDAHWVGGADTSRPAISLLGIPRATATNVCGAYTFCPTHIHWGPTTAAFCAGCTLGQGQANRVEFRAAGADANTYLIIAAVLAAGATASNATRPRAERDGDQYADPGHHAELPVDLRRCHRRLPRQPDGRHARGGFSENFLADDIATNLSCPKPTWPPISTTSREGSSGVSMYEFS